MIIKLTQHLIDNNLASYSENKRVELVSEERSGLYIEIRGGSAIGTFYYRTKNDDGKTCHINIGRTSEVSLAEARKKVMSLKLEISNGTDLNKGKTIKKGDMLLNEMWNEYYDFAKITKRSHVKDEQLFRLRIQPKFGHLKLSEITLRQIQMMMIDIRKEGLSGASADHHGQLMRRLGNMAVKWGYLDVNFARGIQLYHEFNEVNNVPDDKQLQKLINVLNTDSNRQICQLVLFLLSTGCRLNEALSAQWKNINLANRLWTVPVESSKSKRPRYIPLNDSALSILEQMNCLETDAYVFTNPKTQKPYVNVFKPWNRIRSKAGLPKIRLHDLRHMYATFCVNNGCSILEISKLLGHADTRVSQRYSHLSSSTMLTAANSVSKKLEGFMLVKSDADKLEVTA